MTAARRLCLFALVASLGGSAWAAASPLNTVPPNIMPPNTALSDAPQASAQAPAVAEPSLPPLLVKQVSGFPRIIVRLPAGTAAFEPSIHRLGSVLNVALPPAALPANVPPTPPRELLLEGGRTLQAQWSAHGLTLAGLKQDEDVRAVFWPEAGGLPPQLALLFSKAGSKPQVIMPKAQPSPQPSPQSSQPTASGTSLETAVSPQVVEGILGDLQAQAAQQATVLLPPSAPAARQESTPAAAAPLQDLPAQDLPAQDLPAQDLPSLEPVQPLVVLDAGHGGNDPGMTSRWVREADVNLDVVLRVARALRSAGVQVMLTRRADVHLHPQKGTDLELRSRMATTGRASAFISVHVNAAANPAAHGIETYYFGRPPSGQARSLAVRENGGGNIGSALTRDAAAQAEGLLGDLLGETKLSFSRRLATLVQRELVAATGARNRGVKQDAFYVIRRPTTPAILIELGFGSNPVEGQLLATPQYREVQAQAIARAVVRFLNIDPLFKANVNGATEPLPHP